MRGEQVQNLLETLSEFSDVTVGASGSAPRAGFPAVGRAARGVETQHGADVAESEVMSVSQRSDNLSPYQ